MRKPVVLITGANGEIGHGLIDRLSEQSERAIVTLDLAPLDPSISRKVDREITGSILDRGALERILAEFQVELVFHLAALLSTRRSSRRSPRTRSTSAARSTCWSSRSTKRSRTAVR